MPADLSSAGSGYFHRFKGVPDLPSRQSLVLSAGMPRKLRKLRIDYPGAMYHIMRRDDWREKIFLD